MGNCVAVLKTSLPAIAATVVTCGLFLVTKRSVCFLGKDEQLRMQKLTGVFVRNGPGVHILVPLTYRSFQVVKATTLDNTSYAIVQDQTTGARRVELGPKLLFVGAYDEIVNTGKGKSLSSTEYVHVEDKVSGEKSLVIGPRMWFPRASEEGVKKTGISLTSTEYVLIEDKFSGQKRVERGPRVYFPSPTENLYNGSGMKLSNTDYVRIVDTETGQKRIVIGPCVWFPGPYEEGTRGSGITLGSAQYVLVEDKLTGARSVQRGPRVWFPGALESPMFQSMFALLGVRAETWTTSRRQGLQLKSLHATLPVDEEHTQWHVDVRLFVMPMQWVNLDT